MGGSTGRPPQHERSTEIPDCITAPHGHEDAAQPVHGAITTHRHTEFHPPIANTITAAKTGGGTTGHEHGANPPGEGYKGVPQAGHGQPEVKKG